MRNEHVKLVGPQNLKKKHKRNVCIPGRLSYSETIVITTNQQHVALKAVHILTLLVLLLSAHVVPLKISKT